MEEAADADYVILLDSGRVVGEGTPLALKNAYAGDHITLYGVEETAVRALGRKYAPVQGGWRIEVENTREATKLILTQDPKEAVAGADIVCTDTWASMGQEADKEVRKKIFADYQVNAELVKLAADDALVMHCLPAYRGMEITEDVIEGPQSVVFDEAENRLHAHKAILAAML